MRFMDLSVPMKVLGCERNACDESAAHVDDLSTFVY